MEVALDEWLKWFCTLVFIVFITWDVWKAYSRGAFWIPGKVLVLTGLTIQLLDWLESKPSVPSNLKICVELLGLSNSDPSIFYNTERCPITPFKFRFESENCFAELRDYAISTEMSMILVRYTVCVFMGYLLPGMASPINGGTWSNTVALFLSLSIHISKELYVNDQIKNILVPQNGPITSLPLDNPTIPHFIPPVSAALPDSGTISAGEKFNISLYVPNPIRVSLLMLMIGLMVLLVLAVVAGKFISCNLSLKIPIILSDKEYSVENEVFSSRTTECEMLKCWIVARLSQPEYVLARSGFSAAALGMVTFAIGITSSQFLYLWSAGNESSISLFPSSGIIQSIFILIGWIVIFYRWLNVVFYFPGFTQTRRNSWDLFGAIRRRYNQLNDHFVMVISSNKRYVEYKDLASLPLVALVVLPALVVLIIVMVIWMALWMVILGSAALIILVITFFWCVSALFSKVVKKMLKPMTNDEELSTYRTSLQRVVMPGENPATLWNANNKYFYHNKLVFRTGCEGGQNCKELIQMVTSSLATNSVRSFVNRLEPLMSVNELFPSVKEPIWRITAICLLNIILEVVPPAGEDEDEDEDVEIQFKLDLAIKAYEQAEDLMDFADCSQNAGVIWNIFGNCNVQSLAVRHIANKQTKIIKKRYEHLERERLAKAAHHAISIEEVTESIKKQYDAAKKNLEEEYLLGDMSVEKTAYGIYADWKSAGLSYGMYKVCKIILDDVDSHSNVKELFNELISFLGEVIVSCLSESQDLILRSCKQWAAEFEEEKISSSMFIAGKLGGVMDSVKYDPPMATRPSQVVTDLD